MNDEFKSALKVAYDMQNGEIKKKYDRSLPFQDTMFDRWERAKELGFGEGSNIYNSAFVFGNVKVGRGVWVGPYTILDGSAGELVIEDGCSISSGVHIYTHDTVISTLSGGKNAKVGGNVSIGGNTYIGSQSIINCGVSIGEQCVVAANSFVNKSIKDRSIFAGTPAKQIGSVVVENDEIRLEYAK